MDTVSILPPDSIGKGFIPEEYIPDGKDEYHLRNSQNPCEENRWRRLRAEEIEQLEHNGNSCDDWSSVLVTEQFNTDKVRNSEFFGLVRIGNVRDVVLEHQGLRIPAGITNSVIVACDIGDDTAVHDVRHLSHFIIGNRCILQGIGEMLTTDSAKFGNGSIKDGEQESARVWVNLMNESGSRGIVPFNGIIAADAYLWAKYRDDSRLQERLRTITQLGSDFQRGYYGTTGEQCVIRNSLAVKDVRIGSHCCITGAQRLQNITVNSSESEPTIIGEGAELADGIVGFGCRIIHGSKAVRFVLGDNSNLKFGARLIHSFLGDNSTISCCEAQNNLIFPAHEQHHNNSFLIASVVMGQSNIAAGATIGSNHNSRANDGEVMAGRGFWPGLCASVKHSSRFASYVLLSKADYPFELDIPLPFSLLSNNTADNRLEVMPAYWWMYNMYALARNSSKYRLRDGRKRKIQHIEFDYLAPDTVEEIFNARRLLSIWTAKAALRSKGEPAEGHADNILLGVGKRLFAEPPETVKAFEVLGDNMEKSKRKVLILKAYEAYRAYGDMLCYYSVKTLLEYMESNRQANFQALSDAFAGERVREWVNLGGQVMPLEDADGIRADIGSDELTTWEDIHSRYDTLAEAYELNRQKHAFATLRDLYETEALARDQWLAAIDRALGIQEFVSEQVFLSRKKDFDNPFRQSTYRNAEEMKAAVGTAEDDKFVQQVKYETEEFRMLATAALSRG